MLFETFPFIVDDDADSAAQALENHARTVLAPGRAINGWSRDSLRAAFDKVPYDLSRSISLARVCDDIRRNWGALKSAGRSVCCPPPGDYYREPTDLSSGTRKVALFLDIAIAMHPLEVPKLSLS